MVATPWGESETLRDRRLSPGPGASAEDVAKNQRERLFGAMVASVAERGYEATRVADLSKISGVSTRSFYDLFPGGKEVCFLTVLETILDATNAALSATDDREAGWEQRLGETYEAFADMIAAQPATATFCISEAYAAGAVARGLLDRSTAAFERLSRARLAESPERAQMPAEMIAAQVGGLQELARTRLRQGRPEEMTALVPELVSLVAVYRPPPQSLRLAIRAPSFEPESAAAPDDAERALRGLALAAAEQGFAGTTIHEIARLGSMSPSTFYANFGDKREALLAAIDSVMAQLTAHALVAFRRSPGWAPGIRAAIGSALNFLASRPAMANLLLVEIYAGGPEALRWRARGTRPLTEMIDDGRANAGVPAIAPEAIAGGIAALARAQLLRKGAGSLPSLAPICTYIALAPYVGAEEACAAANGDGRARLAARSQAPRQAPTARQTKWTVLTILARRSASAETLAQELGAPVTEVRGYLEELEGDELVERIAADGSEKAPEWANRKRFRVIKGEDWAALTLEERQEQQAFIAREVMADLAEALRQHAFGRRLDDVAIRVLIELDERGWEELAEAHSSAFDATEAIKLKSAKRLQDAGRSGIVGRSLQMLFEMPGSDHPDRPTPDD